MARPRRAPRRPTSACTCWRCCARGASASSAASEMLRRIAATLATLQPLPRHRGHFFNWYDTHTLAVLAPAYLSTVDSGNLSAALVAVAGALRHQDDAACDEAAQAALLRSQAQLAAAQRAGFGPDAGADGGRPRRGAAPPGRARRRGTADGEAPQPAERALWLLQDHLRTVRSLAEDDEPAGIDRRGPGRQRRAARPGRPTTAGSTTRGASCCTSARCSTPPPAASSWTSTTTTCCAPKRGWPAWWRSPRATCRRGIGRG